MKAATFLVFFATLSISIQLIAQQRAVVRVDLAVLSCVTQKNDTINLDLSQNPNGDNDLIFTQYSRNGDLRNWFNIPASAVYQEKFMNGTQIYVPSEEKWFRFYDFGVAHNKQIGLMITDKSGKSQLSSLNCTRDTISRLPFLKGGIFREVPEELRNFFKGFTA